eukprot:scaffold257999_cov32-Tisochrysis_lutea.AAC.4
MRVQHAQASHLTRAGRPGTSPLLGLRRTRGRRCEPFIGAGGTERQSAAHRCCPLNAYRSAGVSTPAAARTSASAASYRGSASMYTPPTARAEAERLIDPSVDCTTADERSAS